MTPRRVRPDEPFDFAQERLAMDGESESAEQQAAAPGRRRDEQLLGVMLRSGLFGANLLRENRAEFVERLRLEPGDVHLRDVQAFGDLGLRDRLIEAQVDDDALAAAQHEEGAF